MDGVTTPVSGATQLARLLREKNWGEVQVMVSGQVVFVFYTCAGELPIPQEWNGLQVVYRLLDEQG